MLWFTTSHLATLSVAGRQPLPDAILRPSVGQFRARQRQPDRAAAAAAAAAAVGTGGAAAAGGRGAAAAAVTPTAAAGARQEGRAGGQEADQHL